jgi:hypothetical protein
VGDSGHVTPPHALLVSGAGRYGDPWHPFPATSEALAEALHRRDCTVTVDDDADGALAGLAAGALPSLLVLNVGWYGPDRFAAPAAEGLVTALRTGLPTLLVHSTLTAFPDWPLWREITGGGWVYGTTYHPDYGVGTALARPEHPLTAGLDRLPVSDERYTGLAVDEDAALFLEHEEGGERHPIGWTRTWGASRIVADALGHDAASYAAEGRRLLLARELDWLLAPVAR